LKQQVVGDDTDILVLLCYHVSLDSHTIFFKPEPKKTPRSPEYGTLLLLKSNYGLKYVATFSFCMQCLDVTLHPMQLFAKAMLLKRFNQVNNFKSVCCSVSYLELQESKP